MAESYPHSLEQILIADWEATPVSVKELVSSLLAQELDHSSTSEALNQGNDRLKRFLDAASVGIAVHNAHGDLVYISQSGKELLTQPPRPQVSKLEELPQAFQIYRSTTQQPYPLEELLSSLALGGEKVHVEDLEVHHPDRIVPLEVMANPIFNPLGEVEYVVATFLDITHRRLSEQALSDRKAAVTALAESEAQNRAIVRAIPDIMFRVNRAGIYLSYSGSKELLLSLGNEQIIGQSMRDYLSPEHYQRQAHYMTIALETGQTQVYEQEVTIAGNLQQEEVRVVPIEDKEEVLFIIRNISDRKRAEQEIIRSRDLREAIFNESTDALFLVESQTGFVFDCNQRAVELFEVTDKADLLGTVGHNFQREQFTEEELAAIQLEIANNKTWSGELEYVTHQGNFFWGSIAVKNVTIAGNTKILVRISDISDRKRVEQEIIHNRDLRDAIFNELADALFLVDSGTLLTLDCNQRAVEIFGATDKAELIGIEGHTLQRHQFTFDEIVDIDREMAVNGFWSREIEYVTRQGSHFWGNIAAKPIIVAGKTMSLVRVTDISDRKRAETKLQQTTQQLVAANGELEAFAYSVSHDLRAPLRAIDGFSKALIEDYGDRFDEEGKDFFNRIHRAVERMGGLIDDLLRLSRVSRAEIHCSQINVTKIVKKIAANLQDSTPDRQVEFAIAPDVMVYADSNLLRVALENLLQNAWKFTSHNPTARIEFGTTQGQGEGSSNSQAETVYFLRDDGAGFDMAYSSMLFGVFQRLHSTHEFPGTGVGLATVQRIIHRHGGRVWAEGAVEAGATIYFTLPDSIAE